MSDDLVPKDCWQTHYYEGFFSIDFPFGIRPVPGDDSTTIAFYLPTNPQSKVIAGIFPTPGNEGATPLVVRSEIERFMTQCVGVSEASYVTPADFEKEGFLAYQAAGVDASGRCCIARLYGRRKGRIMLLVYWVGQEADAYQHVLPVFITIDPVLSEQSSVV